MISSGSFGMRSQQSDNPFATIRTELTLNRMDTDADIFEAYCEQNMDLISAITNFDQASTLSSVQIQVAAKMLSIDQSQGDSTVQLIDAATQGFNQAGDALVAAATGLGGQLDVQA